MKDIERAEIETAGGDGVANSVFSGKGADPSRRQKTRYIREFAVVALLLFALMVGFALFSSDGDVDLTSDRESATLARSADVMASGETEANVPEQSSSAEANVPDAGTQRQTGGIINPDETLSPQEILARAAAKQNDQKPDVPAKNGPAQTVPNKPAGAPIPIVSGPEQVSDVTEHVEAVASLQKMADIFGYLPTRTPPQMSTKAAPPVERSSELHIVIDKVGHTLTVFKGTEKLYTFPCAVGKNTGNKAKKGDMRTPEGKFKVSNIHDASAWTHDFGDGKGQIAGAYGPYFIRLVTPPWTGIGIHGTHDPDSMGKNVSEGCIRLRNADLRKLVPLVTTATTVEILPN